MDGGDLAEQAMQQEQIRQEQDRARDEMLRRICAPQALERLNRVKLVKRDLVEKVEKFIEQQAVSGKLRSQVQESDIVELLSKIGSAASEQKIVIARKKRIGEEDDDDSDSDLR